MDYGFDWSVRQAWGGSLSRPTPHHVGYDVDWNREDDGAILLRRYIVQRLKISKLKIDIKETLLSAICTIL